MTPVMLLAVAVGGALGAVSRVLLAVALKSAFPWATLLANLGGSFLIGAVFGLEAARPGSLPPALRLGLASGFCGSFTTFSTFSQQTLALATQGQTGAALANAALNLAGCLVATALGLWLTSRTLVP
ncbi:MAG: fluoride efflux transporter CrcB [Opitutales bacterium]